MMGPVGILVLPNQYHTAVLLEQQAPALVALLLLPSLIRIVRSIQDLTTLIILLDLVAMVVTL
jgi:hypothetical protein